MSSRPTPIGPLATGIIACEVAVAAAGSGPTVPEWIKVTPRGSAQTRDGRRYSFTPEILVARFKADGIDVAADLDHALALRAVKGERIDAVGYASDLQARPDGTYARVNWLDGGLSALTARTHRYVSPSFLHDEAGNATWLHSIALVAAPALSMPAVAHAAGHHPENPMKQIAKALGLPETADEAACLAALAGRTEVRPIAVALGLTEAATPAACLSAIGGLKSGGDALVGQLQAQLATTSACLEAVETAARDKAVADLLAGALTARKIVPAQGRLGALGALPLPGRARGRDVRPERGPHPARVGEVDLGRPPLAGGIGDRARAGPAEAAQLVGEAYAPGLEALVRASTRTRASTTPPPWLGTQYSSSSAPTP